MSQDSSLVGAFDLNSQTGVMSILASIRGSKLSAPEKNELRDLVFLYTNGGGDASVRIALEQKLATHQIVPIQVAQTTQPGPALPFGSYRPTPTFRKIPQVATVPTSVQAPRPIADTVLTTELSAPIPAVSPVAPIISSPVAQTPVATAVVEPVPVQVPPPVTNQVSSPASEVVVSAPPPLASPVSVPFPTDANYIERIRQIKTAVNSKVGNPVNLVDINNEVGREYMNALLEAMKKLSSGAVSEMEPVMKRLETAYIAVEAAIALNKKPIPPAPVATTPVLPETSIPDQAMPEISVPNSGSEPLPIPVVEREIPSSTPVSFQDLPPRPLPPMPETDISTPLPPPTVEEIPMAEIRLTVPQPLPPRVEQEAVEEPIELESQPTSFALADRQKILTPQDLPEASAVSTGSDGDPLFTKEVDDGLNQLLSDWTLFKKSGLFGTGPKGREHPLFKKVSDLQVPLLLAGRFDGATQEIRQSITDYMNGWRYEQGIIYQPGETFEKYLRRVIKHIIDLQKKHKHS